METNTINVTLFNQVASKRHLNLNQLITNAFSVELNKSDVQFVKSEPPITGRKIIKQLFNK